MTAYYLNPDIILGSPDLSATTKAAMRRAMKQTFLLPGHWVQDLSDIEVAQLIELIETAKREDDEGKVGLAGEEMLILTMILSTAEGCAPEDDTQAGDFYGQLAAFIICESLARKGLVKVFHDKMSFLAPDEIVVQRIE